MLKNLVNRLTRNQSQTPASAPREQFRLYKEDGRYHADPMDVRGLDKFEEHQAAAQELNGLLDQLDKVRTAVNPLEGSELDKNERPDVVAVDGLDVDGKSVDAVIVGRRENDEDNRSIKLEARMVDGNGPIIMEERDHFYTKYYDFKTESKRYEVEDKRDKSFVDVELQRK